VRYEWTERHVVLWLLVWSLNRAGVERMNRALLAEVLGWHRSTVQRNLKGLEARGGLVREGHRVKAILPEVVQ
jgi:DNA-binding MarR family transcriptional regulator